MFKPTPFKIDNDRFYYEPRALWSVGRVGPLLQPQTPGHPAGNLQMPKEHFQNGSRWPIRITHAIVSPIGYLFRDRDAVGASSWDAAMVGVGRMKMAIAFPKRSWIERINTDVMSFATEATAEPGFLDDPTLEHASGLFGVSRWTFDPSYIVPFRASIEIILSTIQQYATLGFLAARAPASLIVHERGGRMLGHGRTRAPANLEYGPTFTTAAPATWPQSHVAVPGDFYAINNGAVGTQNQAFPADQKWPSDDYRRQQAARGLPYTEITGFAVAIAQSQIDDAADAAFAGGRVAPIAQRIITKGRTRDAGTQEAWWRDGAPLSLVTPTMNNCGFVHKFEQPFELGRGEGLEVSLQAPGPRTFTFGQGEITVNPNYNVGVSFLGYAIVEDNNEKVFRGPP